MVGTTAALIGIAAASAGSQAVGAAMQSRAAGKAAKGQEMAARESNNMFERVYRDQQTAYRPYQQAGANSMTLLGALMTPQGQPGAYRPGMNLQTPIQAEDPRAMSRRPPMGGMPPMGGGPPPPSVYGMVGGSPLGNPRPIFPTQGPLTSPMPYQRPWERVY